jgi:hypothetical protein
VLAQPAAASKRSEKRIKLDGLFGRSVPSKACGKWEHIERTAANSPMREADRRTRTAARLVEALNFLYQCEAFLLRERPHYVLALGSLPSLFSRKGIKLPFFTEYLDSLNSDRFLLNSFPFSLNSPRFSLNK